MGIPLEEMGASRSASSLARSLTTRSPVDQLFGDTHHGDLESASLIRSSSADLSPPTLTKRTPHAGTSSGSPPESPRVRSSWFGAKKVPAANYQTVRSEEE